MFTQSSRSKSDVSAYFESMLPKRNASNHDRPRRDNFAADGTSSSAGIGSSIARFQLN